MTLDISRYFSNDWLTPIGEKAREVFLHYPREVAIKSASTVLYQHDSGCVEIPWVTVFPSDDIDQVCTRLLETLRTPDYQTSAFSPQFHEPIKQLRKILSEEHATEGAIACHAAYHLVRVAAGKPEEHFTNYQDLARKWPQYADRWQNSLVEQFGHDRTLRALDQHRELLQLLLKTEHLALQDTQHSLQQDGEDTTYFIKRAITSMNITDIESLVSATKLIDRRNIPYRTAAYKLRGLTTTT